MQVIRLADDLHGGLLYPITSHPPYFLSDDQFSEPAEWQPAGEIRSGSVVR